MKKDFQINRGILAFLFSQFVIWLVFGSFAWLLNDLSYKESMSSQAHVATFIVGLIPSVLFAMEFDEWWSNRKK